MTLETASLQLPKDLIEGAIQREVSLSIAKALGDNIGILDAVVQRVLTQKVNDKGEPSEYRGNAEFIQWAVNDALKTAVKQALKDEIGKHSAAIKKNIAAQLSRKSSPLLKQLINGMASGVEQALQSKWRLQVSVAYDDATE